MVHLTARFIMASAIWGSARVYGAISLDGSHVSMPVTDEDPSPIADPTLYDPNQHDCPKVCRDYANPHSWIPYNSVNRLHACKEPMLLDFSVNQPLDDPASRVLIRACTLKNGSHKLTPAVADSSVGAEPMANPKKDKTLYQGSLNTAPACSAEGDEVEYQPEFLTLSGNAANSTASSGDGNVAGLLESLQRYFEEKDNCDEKFGFVTQGQLAVGMYMGENIGKATVGPILKAFGDRLGKDTPERAVAQLCGSGILGDRAVGIAIDTMGDLAAVQRVAWEWSRGECASDAELKPSGLLEGVKMFKIGGQSSVDMMQAAPNRAFESENSTVSATPPFGKNSRIMHRGALHKREVCRTHEVQSGQGDCALLASLCGISGYDFTQYNAWRPDMCSTLMAGDKVCCSGGDPPPKPEPPKKNADGTCATHLIANGDTCSSIASKFGVTVRDLDSWNAKKTWAWLSCDEGLLKGYTMCLSDGDAPLPAPQDGTACGPMVPGTVPPGPGTSLADLNPCPLKACCSNWGFCGPFEEHCAVNSPGGNAGPGATKKGVQNTCVSNCGQEIKMNSGPPASFGRIGYYESFNFERDCLYLQAKNANADGSYTHIQWAFADIDPNTWKLVIKDPKNQWGDFKALNVKCIVSIGGWAYSTEVATFNIVRQAIIDNYETFAENIAQFLEDEGIDGVDIDLEYPGAPDILVDGNPIGQKGDGAAYLRFLTTLKEKVGHDKSVSIAAPASYWYLQAFPIDRIAAVVDYIVYMTYDLHGQWDYGNKNVFESCDSGKCIRSHVNLTETRNSLSIITKAGVPNNKIYVGESSYGRSFHMVEDGCWEPMCEFTGSRTESDARPGRCTQTGGYLAYAEIEELIKKGDGKSFHDSGSDSDILLYRGDYVAYMTPATKNTRRNDWKKLNFAGTVDWAVDLLSFTTDEDAENNNGSCEESEKPYSKETMPKGEFATNRAVLDEQGNAIPGTHYVSIVNLTPYKLVKYHQHSYQMKRFEFGDIPSGKARQCTVEYEGGSTKSLVDTAGEAYFSLEGTEKKFEIRARTNDKSSYPNRVIMDLSGLGLGQREYGAPHYEVGVSLVLIGSEDYGFISSISYPGEGNWMRGLKDVIGDRELRHVVIPGSHDSGMRKLQDGIGDGHGWIGGGSVQNTLTQSLNVYEQLLYGVRYFDLRLVSVAGGSYYAAHVDNEKSNTPFGGTGEKFEDIRAGINKFTEESPGEIIILWIKYMVDMNLDVPAGKGRMWDEKKVQDFYDALKGINNRCPGLDVSTSFEMWKINDFMDQNNGAGCVLIITDGALNEGATNRDDYWAKEENNKKLAEKQISHLLQRPRDGGSSDTFNIMQWQSTFKTVTSVLGSLSLEESAMHLVNPALYHDGVNAMSPQHFPTVIMQDYVGQMYYGRRKYPDDMSWELRTLCLGLNIYMVSQNCEASHAANPLYKTQSNGSTRMLLSEARRGQYSSHGHNVTLTTSATSGTPVNLASRPAFRGIIYFNGTVDTNPPPRFHLGRLKTLKAGTKFHNGTTLEADIPNPDYDAEY